MEMRGRRSALPAIRKHYCDLWSEFYVLTYNFLDLRSLEEKQPNTDMTNKNVFLYIMKFKLFLHLKPLFVVAPLTYSSSHCHEFIRIPDYNTHNIFYYAFNVYFLCLCLDKHLQSNFPWVLCMSAVRLRPQSCPLTTLTSNNSAGALKSPRWLRDQRLIDGWLLDQVTFTNMLLVLPSECVCVWEGINVCVWVCFIRTPVWSQFTAPVNSTSSINVSPVQPKCCFLTVNQPEPSCCPGLSRGGDL